MFKIKELFLPEDMYINKNLLEDLNNKKQRQF